jgi:3',5'-nucleoside bisphosphate phosphatase
MLIDLQLHSAYSDGLLTPSQLVNLISAQGIKVAALTDHNTVGGLDEFRQACEKYKIKAITGLELYVKLKHKKFNLLWYNFDDTNPKLHELLRLSQLRRRNQMRRALIKLKRLGLIINENKILDKYNHYVPLNRIIKDIWLESANRKKIAKRLGIKSPREDEVIKHFFHNRKINKLEECYINLKHIIKLKKEIGGQIILNHPGKSVTIDKNFIGRLKNLGFDGVEVISPHHSIGAVMYLQNLAKHFNLIMTGGSDYHFDEPEKVNIKNVYSYFKIDSKYLSGIEKIIG